MNWHSSPPVGWGYLRDGPCGFLLFHFPGPLTCSRGLGIEQQLLWQCMGRAVLSQSHPDLPPFAAADCSPPNLSPGLSGGHPEPGRPGWALAYHIQRPGAPQEKRVLPWLSEVMGKPRKDRSNSLSQCLSGCRILQIPGLVAMVFPCIHEGI